MADESDLQTHASDREDTMLYRHPVLGEPVEGEITDIWGTKLETRIVDANADEFSQLLAAGWVRNPTEIGVGIVASSVGDATAKVAAAGAPADAAVSDDTNAALNAAEKLARELGERVKTLTAELEQARAEAVAAAEHVKHLEGDLAAEKALRAAGSEHIRRLEEEAKAVKAAKKP